MPYVQSQHAKPVPIISTTVLKCLWINTTIIPLQIDLVCLQLPHDMHAMETFDIQRTCELSLFSFKLSKLIRYL